MDLDINPLEDERWQIFCTRIFIGYAILILGGLIIFPFDPSAGFLLWSCSFGGAFVYAMMLRRASQQAYRCISCKTTFLRLPSAAVFRWNRSVGASVHCPTCRVTRSTIRFIVVYR